MLLMLNLKLNVKTKKHVANHLKNNIDTLEKKGGVSLETQSNELDDWRTLENQQTITMIFSYM